VAIKRSSAHEIDRLVSELSAERADVRDAAVARLTIFGARAVERLAAVVASTASRATRLAALGALDAIGDPRGRKTVFTALAGEDAVVAVAAAAVARGYLHGPHGDEALDCLTHTALDRSRTGAVRAAAVDALRQLDAATIAPLVDALRADGDAAVRTAAAAASGRTRASTQHPAAILAAAARGELPPQADLLRSAVVQAGAGAPLPALLAIVEAVLARERREPAPARAEWTAVRAAVHLALASRGSRIALYDLRDSLVLADARLPVEWIAALSAIGDAACLEPIAAAHARAADVWWREHLAQAFRAIVQREGLTRRHAVMKRIEKKWPLITGHRPPATG
jgi:hypothetical protein